MLNEFAYCPRLFYLEWVQAEFSDNLDVVEGLFAHRRVEKEEGSVPEQAGEEGIHAKSVYLFAPAAGLTAKLDLLKGEGGTIVSVDYGPPPTLVGWLERDPLLAHAEGDVVLGEEKVPSEDDEGDPPLLLGNVGLPAERVDHRGALDDVQREPADVVQEPSAGPLRGDVALNDFELHGPGELRRDERHRGTAVDEGDGSEGRLPDQPNVEEGQLLAIVPLDGIREVPLKEGSPPRRTHLSPPHPLAPGVLEEQHGLFGELRKERLLARMEFLRAAEDFRGGVSRRDDLPSDDSHPLPDVLPDKLG
jgi:hypothetical protein